MMLVSACEKHYFFKTPNMIGQASGHCRSDSQRLVDSGEIVMHGMDRSHVDVMLDFLEERRVAQAFDLAGIASAGGAPSFAAFREGWASDILVAQAKAKA